MRMFAGRQIVLNLEEIAAADQHVGVGAGRKLGDVDIVVLGFDGVVTPGAAAHQRAGKGEARNELVEANSVQIAKRRNEVCGVEAELVVAHAGIEGDDSAGGAAELDGVARASPSRSIGPRRR